MAGYTIHAGHYAATLRPDCALLCTSLRYRGDDYVAWPRPITMFRAGHATAVPLTHPWANRLHRWGYNAAGRRVDLRGLALPADGNHLPMHGNLVGVPFDVVRATRDRLVARLDYGAHPDKLKAFPFPHTVTVDARLHAERGLAIATTITPTAECAVPISFGWHPYLRMPRTPRTQWELHWPACEHVEVDAHTIPTGRRTTLAKQTDPIGSRTFDDQYALGTNRTFGLVARDRILTMRFGPAYPYAQLFVPARRQLLALEPMTAEIDALNRGTAPIVEPGDTFRATFSIRVDVRRSSRSSRRASTRPAQP